MVKSKYSFLVEPNEDGGFYVFFPDFPTVFTGGETVNEAIQNAFEALTGHIETLQQLGRLVPNPISNMRQKIQTLALA